jgi:hypothetical protein
LNDREARAVQGMLNVAHELPTHGPNPEQMRTLEKVPLPGTTEDEPANAADLVRGVEHLGESGMMDKMLSWRGRTDPRYTYMLLNILAITVMWFGCNNAAKEIVKEEAIYGRERAVNLGIAPYLGSKFLLLSVMSALQALLLLGIVYGGLNLFALAFHSDVPFPAYRLTFWGEFGVMALLSMVGVAAGLLLSACVNSPDRANALLPYVLIPQIILGGGLLPIKHEPLQGLAMALSPVYWAYRGTHRGATGLPTEHPLHMGYDDSVWIACAALVVQMVVLLGLTAWFLRRKDVGRG